MVILGSALSRSATRLLLLGSGELGKEVCIEAQRLGLEVIAVDRYANAPAMQIAHRSHVISMLDPVALRDVINIEKPDYIVPEVEAIATEVLVELEKIGFNVIPTATATRLTMDREGIRRLASETLNLATSPYRFADTLDECIASANEIGFPCVIKPVMSSSGRGQSVARNELDINKSWEIAVKEGRGNASRVIVEGFVEFDYEITLLTIRHRNGTSFCPPIGHIQIDGDYRESWQPHPMKSDVLITAQTIAEKVTSALGGWGIFGVELFIKDDDVLFSEVSPRPHDTGMVTLISQNYSEFALHVRAILGLPLPEIFQLGPSASNALVYSGNSNDIRFENLEGALEDPDINIRLFGKPDISGHRRLGVVLAISDSIESARSKAKIAASKVKPLFD
ncbi:MAG: phosphoribosylglycinamide formyltransferase 2 [Chloroflexi bacterium]|nr:phosphoribosylglycinamide formyltransferase 2 [Chloroflexota bacterium]|tara:strand:- start:2512 stop:3696 length:1185 start_codon:yes stop_codon:yes gene_type:complete